MLYILTGQDDYSLTRALEEIKKGLGDPELLASTTTILDGQQVVPDEVKNVCATVPFLAEKRLVIIKGLLQRFEAAGRRGRQTKTSRTSPAEDARVFAACFTGMPDTTVLVLLEGVLNSKNPLLVELAGKAAVKTFPLVKGNALQQWVQNQVKAEGGSITPRAVELLTRVVGSNLWTMAGEVNKLTLFASGRPIEEEDVKILVSSAQETSVFAMVDAIVEFKIGVAERLVEQLLQQGAAPTYLLFMLVRQVRMIVRARELKKQGKPEVEIQRRLGVTSEFALRRTVEQSQRYSWARLKEVYQELLEADLAIKTGKYDAELALNILVADLCRQRGASVA
ncbi:MAG: DNA polymerase III subunit delta [Dehalococcoidales bacterium]|nr:DNA polymerase III subunit delta [Dehalococcoidales bacterium]